MRAFSSAHSRSVPDQVAAREGGTGTPRSTSVSLALPRPGVAPALPPPDQADTDACSATGPHEAPERVEHAVRIVMDRVGIQSNDPVSRKLEVPVAGCILTPGRWSQVSGAVHLQHHAAPGPEHVDLDLPAIELHRHVYLWERYACALEEPQHPALEEASGSGAAGLMHRECLCQPPASPAPRMSLQLVPHGIGIQQLAVGRLVDGTGQLVLVQEQGEVEERSIHRRDRKPAIQGDIALPERRRSNGNDAGRRRAPSGEQDVDLARLPPQHPPAVSRAAGTEDPTGCQDGGHAHGGRSKAAMPDGIDAMVDPMEPSAAQPQYDCTASYPELEELATRHDAMLAAGPLGDARIDPCRVVPPSVTVTPAHGYRVAHHGMRLARQVQRGTHRR